MMTNSTIKLAPPGQDGLTWRPITRDYLHQLVDLAKACFLSDGGIHFLFEPDEIGSRFFPDEPGIAIGAFNVDGQMVACSRVSASDNPGTAHATIVGHVRPDLRGRGIGTYLVGWSQAQAGLLLAGAAPDQRTLQIRTESLTQAASHLYEAHGFKNTFEELVMRRDLDLPLPEHGLPADVALTNWHTDLAEQFFLAYDAAFRERPGFPGYNVAEWVNSWTTDQFVPEWSFLARAGDAPIGFLMSSNGTIKPLHGFIMQVGVIPSQRQRGLGSGLVVEVLRRMQAAGAVSGQLVVNVNNPGAIQTYVELGFVTIGRRARYESS